MSAPSRPQYHHGDLRAVILAETARLVGDQGADGVSLRQLARKAGVSHAAPAHHFTDRRGLFTALAAEGFWLLWEALKAARGDFADAALAYVRFAIAHPVLLKTEMSAGHGGISGRYERWKEVAFQYAWLLATADSDQHRTGKD